MLTNALTSETSDFYDISLTATSASNPFRIIFFDQDSPPPSKHKKALETSLKIASFILTFSGNFPYLPVTMKGAKNEILGGLCFAGANISMTALNTSAAWPIIASMVGNLPKPLKRIFENKFSLCEKVFIYAGATFFGIGGVIPTAAVANNVPSALLIASSNVFLSIFSAKLTLEKLFLLKRSDVEKQIRQYQQSLGICLQDGLNQFLHMNREKQIKVVKKIAGFPQTDDVSELLKYMICPQSDEEGPLPELGEENALLQEELQKPTRGKCRKTAHVIVYSVGLGLSVSQQFALGMLSSNAIETLTNSPTGSIIAATSIALMNLYFTAHSVANMGVELFDGVIDFLSGNYAASISEQLRPALATALKIVAFICSFFFYASAFGMAEEAFSSEPLSDAFGYLLSISFALFTLKASRQFSIDFLNFLVTKQGSPEEIELLKCSKLWLLLSHAAIEGHSDKLAPFFLSLDDQALELIGKPEEIRKACQSYIESLLDDGLLDLEPSEDSATSNQESSF